MRVWTAMLALRLPLGQGSALRGRAMDTVLRAAGSGTPAAMRAVSRVLHAHDPEPVWRAWLRPSVSGAAAQRWAAPLVARLLEASVRVPVPVVEAAWRDWLAQPTPVVWSLVQRWGRAAPSSDPQLRALTRLALGDAEAPVPPGLLAGTAARFDHPIGERARARLLAGTDPEAVELFCKAALHSPDPQASTFCAAHHLAPSDEVERAVFFVCTGQAAQYQALDPDGALLALAYRGASTGRRTALRAAMTALGGVDVLRVLAGQRATQDDGAALTEQERGYLVRQLTDRRDWDRLWPLTLLMPLTEAVETVRAFGDWRPRDEDDRRVFEALRGAEPPRQALRALSLPHVRIPLHDLDERVSHVFDLDFSPDGTQIAFACITKCAGIADIGSASLARLYADFPGSATAVAHLGSDTIVVTAGGHGLRDQHHTPDAVHYLHGGAGRVLAFPSSVSFVGNVARIAGDQRFLVLAEGDHEGRELHMFLGQSDGPLRDSGALQGQGIWRSRVAVDPSGRLAAVASDRSPVVADLAGGVVNVLPSAPTGAGGDRPHLAMSPSALVRCTRDGDLDVWHDPLTATQPPLSRRVWPRGTRPIGVAWSPALNRFVAVSEHDPASTRDASQALLFSEAVKRSLNVLDLPQSVRVTDATRLHMDILDVPATPDAALPDALVSARIPIGSANGTTLMRMSPKGDMLAVATGHTRRTIDVYATSALLIRPIIGKPLGLMTHGDLADVIAASGNPALDDTSRHTLTLLRMCLEHRFRHDVGIAHAPGTRVVAPDDIALGGRGQDEGTRSA